MFRKLSLLAATLAFLSIVLGTYFGLSNAGLGCAEWPDCYGRAVTSSANFVPYFLEHLGDIQNWKALSHQYVSGALSVVLLLMLPFAGRVKQFKSVALTLTVGLILLVVAQALLGMWAVNRPTMPIITTVHLLLGLATFWGLSWGYIRFTPDITYQPSAKKLSVLAIAGALVLVIQIILGSWVSSNFAALACTDFPRCRGAWLPEADFAGALNFLNGLINDNPVELSGKAQLAIHWLHRAFAIVTFVVLTFIMLSATHQEQPKAVQRSGLWLSFLLLIEIALGIYAVKNSLPIGLTVAHDITAALIMLPLMGIYFFNQFSTAVQTVDLPEEIEAATIAFVAEEEKPVDQPASVFVRLKTQLKKTRTNLGAIFDSLSSSSKKSSELLEDMEASLLMADVGIETTTTIINSLTQSLEHEQLANGETLAKSLKITLYNMLLPCSQPLIIPDNQGPFVILVVGVNGAGKTTTIGKLAHRLQAEGKTVMLAAGDTFRAAAVEQLQTWGERNNVTVVAQHTGADSASVIFDALQSAKSKGVDVLIADTAGRLHTKSNLMDELKKIKRIMSKLDEQAPHEVLLVLDAGTGQNALSQAKLFNEAVNLTGIALTKLDGTAKGGVIFALANQLHIPIRFIGVGETIEDLQDFNAQTFVEALFTQD